MDKRTGNRDDQGREIPDPTPMEVPLEFGPQGDSLFELVKRAVHDHAEELDSHGIETFEEADDFYVEDEEPEIITEYEMTQMIEEFEDESARSGDLEEDARGSEDGATTGKLESQDTSGGKETGNGGDKEPDEPGE